MVLLRQAGLMDGAECKFKFRPVDLNLVNPNLAKKKGLKRGPFFISIHDFICHQNALLQDYP